MLNQAKNQLLAEKARLLKAKGPGEKTAGKRIELSGLSEAYRKQVAEAQKKLSKILSASQAEIINNMIAPPSLPQMTRERLGQQPGGKGKAGPRAMTQEQRQELRKELGNRRTSFHPVVDLDRLVKLLEEKQAAMK
jgi:hypothetical protein